jgi:hypothetical protein
MFVSFYSLLYWLMLFFPFVLEYSSCAFFSCQTPNSAKSIIYTAKHMPIEETVFCGLKHAFAGDFATILRIMCGKKERVFA